MICVCTSVPSHSCCRLVTHRVPARGGPAYAQGDSQLLTVPHLQYRQYLLFEEAQKHVNGTEGEW